MASLFRDKNYQFSADDGTPLNAGKVYFYTSSGGVGTSTPRATYPTEADALAGTNANPNPVVLASDGRPDNSGTPIQIWIAGEYRVRVETSGATLVSDDAGVKDAVSSADFQSSSPTYGGTAGGTANALTFAFSPTLTALTNGGTYRGRVGASPNTTAVTINSDGTGTKSLTWPDGDALTGGELPANAHIEWTYNLGQDRYELQSVSGPVIQGTHTIMVPASAMVSRTTNGAPSGVVELTTNDVMLASKDFDQTTSEGVQFMLPVPKSVSETTFTAQFGWTAASGTGTVTWSISALAVGDDDAMDAAFGSAQAVTDTLLTANDMHITSATAAVTPSGTWTEGDALIVQITRDIADTLNADAKLLWCKVLVTINASNDA